MRAYLRARWRFLAAVPRDVLIVVCVAVTWGCWLAHTVGVNVERSRWEAQRWRMEQFCIPGPQRSGRVTDI